MSSVPGVASSRHPAILCLASMAMVSAIPATAGAQIRHAPTTTTARAAASDSFTAGIRAFEAQDYARALSLFQTVYVDTQEPAVLYNIGLTLEALHRPVDAARALRQFLARVPSAPNRGQVEQRIAQLDAQAAATPAEQPSRAPDAAAVPAGTTGTTPRDTVHVTRPVGGLVVAGIGVLGLGAGGLFAGLRAIAIGNCTMISSDTLDCPTPADQTRALTGRTYTIAADVAFGAGGALLVAGALWYLLGARSEHIQVAVMPARDGGSIVIGGSL